MNDPFAGQTAPRVTPADIEAVIASEYYFTAGQGVTSGMHMNGAPHFCYESSLDRLTFCVLVLRNGFVVTGENACVSSENFDAEIGRQEARKDAVGKMWPLLGYELKSRLANTPPPCDNAHVAPGCEQFPVPDPAPKPDTIGTFMCPRRGDVNLVFKLPAMDFIRSERGTCSYCGSMDADAFMARVEAGTIEIGTTDKDYKVYVHGEGIKAIKFYFQHLSVEQRMRFVELMNEKRIKFEGGQGFYVKPFFVA